MISRPLLQWFEKNIDYPFLEELPADGLPGNVTAAILLADGRTLVGDYRGDLRLFDFIHRDESIPPFRAHSGYVHDVVQLQDGRVVSVGSWRPKENNIKLWDIETWTCLRTMSGNHKNICCCRLLPLSDGRLLSWSFKFWCFGNGDDDDDDEKEINTLQIWDVDRGVCVQSTRSTSSSSSEVLQLSDGNILLCIGSEMAIWNLESGAASQELAGHERRISCILQLQDGRVASSSNDTTIKIWDVPSGRCVRTLSGHTSAVRSVLQLSRSSHLLSCSFDRTMRVWDPATGECLSTLSSQGRLEKIAQLADGRVVARSQFPRGVEVWRIDCEEDRRNPPPPSPSCSSCPSQQQGGVYRQYIHQLIHKPYRPVEPGVMTDMNGMVHLSHWNVTELATQRWVRRRGLLLLAEACRRAAYANTATSSTSTSSTSGGVAPPPVVPSMAFRIIADLQGAAARYVLVEAIARFL